MKFHNDFTFCHWVWIVIVLFIASCNKDDAITELIDSGKLTVLEESDDVVEEISSILVEVYLDEESPVFSKMDFPIYGNYLSECAIKTVEVVEDEKIITIDYGDGCHSINEKLLKGKLTMSYDISNNYNKKLVTYGFDDFYLDDKEVTGLVSCLMEKNILGIHKRATYTEDILIAWEDGSTASRKGTRLSELVSVAESGSWWSKAFEISGSWSTTTKSGEVYTVEIKENLRKELLCRFIVGGKKMISKGVSSGIIDFGDGSCDSEGTFTNSDGSVEDLDLTKKRLN